MDDSTGLLSRLVAIPLCQFKLDDSLGYVVLPGARRTAPAKLPVYVGDQSHRASHLICPDRRLEGADREIFHSN
jgi:hypothetical protein